MRKAIANLKKLDLIQKDVFRDRVVLISLTSESAGDFFYTPYSRGIASNQDNRFAGGFIHADVASQLIASAIDRPPLILNRLNLTHLGLVYPN